MRHRELQKLLIGAGLVTADHVGHAVHATAGTHGTWLEHLVQQRMVSERAVCELAARAAFVPMCELHGLEQVDDDVIAELPWDLAVEYRALPVAVEADHDLRIAMLDPCDEDACTELGFFLGRRVLREAAPATAVAWALHRYYGFRSLLWPQQQPQPVVQQVAPAARVRLPSQRSKPMVLRHSGLHAVP
ncbi:MAG TPA: hypothetical protein VHE35_04370 [Kofleriaceae bacterium]|nr:hypothetical protein [Kofleriaceae bacterium]